MKNSPPPSGLSATRSIRKAFDRLSHGLEEHDALSREAAQRLIDHSDAIRLAPHCIADLGCGARNSEIRNRFPDAQILSVDLSRRLLACARDSRAVYRIQADSRRLPFPSQSLDLVFSNLLLPWIAQPGQWLEEIRRIGKPGSLLLFSSPGPNTLGELQSLWRELGVSIPNPLFDMQAMGNLLLQAGFSDPVLESDSVRLRYRDLNKMLKELRAAGACIWLSHRRRSLTGKHRMETFMRSCEAHMNAGRFELQVELIYGHAWIVPKAAAWDQANRAQPIRFRPTGQKNF